MLRLTREVRFALNSEPARPARNAHAGLPPLTAIAPWGALRITVTGAPDPASQYLLNIKDIDAAVRARAVPLLQRESASPIETFPILLARALHDAWLPATLHAIECAISPYLSAGFVAAELPMIRLSQKFEFSASHRLHNAALSVEENRRLFGKCNNPHGHGHNYELQVTLVGEPTSTGGLLRAGQLDRIVHEAVIDPFDHRHLNIEVPEFADLNPTVENIAMVVFRRLQPHFTGTVRLASVTVWETPRTWCEYSE